MYIYKSRCTRATIIFKAILWKFAGFTCVAVPCQKHLFSSQREAEFFNRPNHLSRLTGSWSCHRFHKCRWSSSTIQKIWGLEMRILHRPWGITLALDAWPHIYKEQLDPYNSQSPLWKVAPLCSTPEKSERGISSYCKGFLCRSNPQRSLLLDMWFKLHSLTFPGALGVILVFCWIQLKNINLQFAASLLNLWQYTWQTYKIQHKHICVVEVASLKTTRWLLAFFNFSHWMFEKELFASHLQLARPLHLWHFFGCVCQ